MTQKNLKNNNDLTRLRNTTINELERIIQFSSGCDSSFYMKLDPRLKDDEEFALKVIELGDLRIYDYLSKPLKSKKSIALALIEKDKSYFHRINQNLWRSKDVVMLAISKGELVMLDLYQNDIKLIDDKDVAFSAIKLSTKEFEWCGYNLRKDKEIIEYMIQKDPKFFQSVNGFIRDDKDFIMYLLKKYPDKVKYIVRFVGDEDIALEVVNQKPTDIQFLDIEARKNDKVVLAAIRKDGKAIKYAFQSYLQRKEFVQVALLTYPELYEELGTVLKSDPDIINTISTNYHDYFEDSTSFQTHYQIHLQSQLLAKYESSLKEITELKNQLTEIKEKLSLLEVTAEKTKDEGVQRKLQE